MNPPEPMHDVIILETGKDKEYGPYIRMYAHRSILEDLSQFGSIGVDPLGRATLFVVPLFNFKDVLNYVRWLAGIDDDDNINLGDLSVYTTFINNIDEDKITKTGGSADEHTG